nr:hypothetical protein [Canibacter zhuwentaonis]
MFDFGVLMTRVTTVPETACGAVASDASLGVASHKITHTRGRLARVRLTPKGRVFFVTLSLLSAGIVFGLTALGLNTSAAVASNESTHEQQFSYIMPLPGDTLYEIAQELDPERDPRDTVAEIIKLNNLSGGLLKAYEPIAIPLQYSDSKITVSAADVGR